MIIDNIVDEWSTEQFIVQIVITYNWRGLEVYNPNLPRYLVKLIDKSKNDGGKCIKDSKLHECAKMLERRERETLLIMDKAFKQKEEQNRPNLKHPENRDIEKIFRETYESGHRKRPLKDVF